MFRVLKLQMEGEDVYILIHDLPARGGFSHQILVSVLNISLGRTMEIQK